MTTYTIFAARISTMENPMSQLEMMQTCEGGGVKAYGHATIIEFLNKDAAIKAKERLEANGIKILTDIVEADNPAYQEI